MVSVKTRRPAWKQRRDDAQLAEKGEQAEKTLLAGRGNLPLAVLWRKRGSVAQR